MVSLAIIIKKHFAEDRMANNRISQRRHFLTTAFFATAVSLGLMSVLGCSGTTLAKGFVQILAGPVQVGTGGQLVVFAETTPTGVTWAITPGTGCTGSGCGTITGATSTSVTYNGPVSIPGASATFTLTATSTANPSLSASQTYTIFPVGVVITGPTSSTVNPLTSAQFTATVPGDPTTDGVSWSISGANCSGNGLAYTNCGTLTNATNASVSYVTYTAPAAPIQETITLTATSVGFSGTYATYIITVPKLAVYSYTPTTLPFAVAGIPYAATVLVTGNTPPYTFTTSNLPSWATLTPTSPATGTFFTITGTPPVGTQGAAFVQVNVSDSATPVDSASQNFTIPVYPNAATGNNLLTGTYAFYANGWLDGTIGSSAFQGLQYIGSFTADGKGNITGGEMDVNNFQTGLTGYSSLTGTYNIQYAENSSGNPLANFQTGFITLILPGNARPITMAVTFRAIQYGTVIPPATTAPLTSNIATAADFIEFDDTTGDSASVNANSSGQRVAGTIALQNASALSQVTSPFTVGGFAFGMMGNSSQAFTSDTCFNSSLMQNCGPISLAGAFNISSTGVVTAGEEDVMFAIDYNAAVAKSVTGSFGNSGATDSYGRMTASIVNSVATASGSTMIDWPSDYIAYAIDAQHFYFMSSDSYQNYSAFIGTATYQNPIVATVPFNTSEPVVLISSVVTTQYFTQSPYGPNGKVRTNIQTFTPVLGASGCTATQYGLGGAQYQNLSGTYTTATVGSDGTYCNTVSANGRVQPALTSAGEAEPILYLTSTSTGYGTQWNTGSGPGLWTAIPRTASSLNAGNYSASMFSPASIEAPLEVGILTVPTGGVTYGSATAAVAVTGTDFTQFSATNEEDTAGEGILYTGPWTGTLKDNGSLAAGGVTYTGYLLKNSIVLNPSTYFQACNLGYGFVISSTSFVCIDTNDQFSTPHIFQQ